MTDLTIVFRRFPEGDIIALFPHVPSSSKTFWTCESYMHLGQHAQADPSLIEHTSACPPDDYHDLLLEIAEIYPEYKIMVKDHIEPEDHRIRIRAFKSSLAIRAYST